jgi:hypothetical protein
MLKKFVSDIGLISAFIILFVLIEILISNIIIQYVFEIGFLAAYFLYFRSKINHKYLFYIGLTILITIILISFGFIILNQSFSSR